MRGVHSIGKGVIWASGTDGTILRSEDDGYMWQQCAVPPDGAKLDFRAVFAWDGDHAMTMSSGPGVASRLYETTDGCSSWRLTFLNPDRDGFWDTITFRGKDGYLAGDPVNGRFVIYKSTDGGAHWQRDNDGGLAVAQRGESLFAASNSALVMRPDGSLVLATGGPGGPRVLRRDASGHWSNVEIPLARGADSAGVFSLAFRDNSHGVVVGGDFKSPAKREGTAAWTSDGGATWHAATGLPAGYRSSVAWAEKLRKWIAVGSNGTDVSADDGHTWKHLDPASWNALSLPWVVGAKGRIGSLDESKLR